ncbi:MAG: outer membrane beta-barrel protein [Candidatus Aminicenantes bacterium]
MNHHFPYGSEQDYVLGENDFPVTPGHTPFNWGAALAVLLGDNIGVELDGRYTLSSRLTLKDPSDQDTVEIDSSKHYAITLNFIYRFFEGRIRPYILAGGGIDKLLADPKTYASEYGYEIEFLPPEKTTDPVVNIGAGTLFSLSPRLGVRLDVRYTIIFADPQNVNSLNATAGLLFGF